MILRWPSAVAPPWLPIAGIIKGSAPNSLRLSAADLMISAIFAIPLLPAVIATLIPGLNCEAILSCIICSLIIEGILSV
jgi:hypothetical protein